MKRITVIMPDEVYDKVIQLGKKENRKKSPMAAMLIEDGLKLSQRNGIELSGDSLVKFIERNKKINENHRI